MCGVCGECVVCVVSVLLVSNPIALLTNRLHRRDLSINLLIDLCISVITSLKPGVQMW